MRFKLGELVVPEPGHDFHPIVCKVVRVFEQAETYLIDNGHGEKTEIRDDQLASVEYAAAHMMMTDPKFKDRSLVIVTPEEGEA